MFFCCLFGAELNKECRRDSDRSPLDREDSEDMDPLSLAIAIVVTFVVTALLVAFLATTIGLVVNARKKRSGGKETLMLTACTQLPSTQ